MTDTIPGTDAVKPVATRNAVLGAVLALARQYKGLTQAQLAKALDLAPSTWSRIEKGETALSVEQLRDAAETLGIPAATVLTLVSQAEMGLKKIGVGVESKQEGRTAAPGTAASFSGAWGFAQGLLGRGLFQLVGATLGALVGQTLEEALVKAFEGAKKGEVNKKEGVNKKG